MEILKKHYILKKTLDKSVLGLPFTPSYWINEFKYTNLSVIELTYGGGMGGSHEYLYCNRIFNLYDALRENEFLTVNTVQGGEVIINTRYVVKANNNHQMLTAVLNSKHPNKTGLHEFNFLIPNGLEITFGNEFDRNLI